MPTGSLSTKEIDPNGKGRGELGAKFDVGKPAIYRGVVDYFPRALYEVARVSTFGASKYAWKGWESVPDGYNRYSDALHRHELYKAIKDNLYDSDSGLLHDAHSAWNSLARLELYIRDNCG